MILSEFSVFSWNISKKAGFTPNVYYKSSHDLNVAYDFLELNRGIFVFVERLTHVEKYNNIRCIPIDESDVFWDIGFIVKKNTKKILKLVQQQ